MTVEIKLPALGENIESGQVVQVLVNVGDVIQRDQTVMEIESGKANLELPAPSAGRVVSVAVAPGQTVKVGELLLVLEESAAAAGPPTPAAPTQRPAGKEAPVAAVAAPPVPAPAPASALAPVQPGHVGIPAAPHVRQFAREIAVPIEDVAGSGPAGRISVEDVKRHAREVAQGAAGRRPAAAQPLPPPALVTAGPVEREPLSSVRLLTAQQMQRSWSAVPHVMLERKADITGLEAFRLAHRAAVERAGGKLTVTSILVKIVAGALRAFPRVNASLDLDARELVLKKYVHVGVATDTPRGLLVPVVRDADTKSVAQISVELSGLSERARAGRLQLSELSGAGFSVTNLGGLGIGHFTAVINPPEISILAVGKAQLEPVYGPTASQLRPRLMMPLSLSIDHRALDGADGARFLGWIVSAIEEPLSVLLG